MLLESIKPKSSCVVVKKDGKCLSSVMKWESNVQYFFVFSFIFWSQLRWWTMKLLRTWYRKKLWVWPLFLYNNNNHNIYLHTPVAPNQHLLMVLYTSKYWATCWMWGFMYKLTQFIWPCTVYLLQAEFIMVKALSFKHYGNGSNLTQTVLQLWFQ